MSISLVDEAERELLLQETALMKTQGYTNSSDFSKYIYTNRNSQMSDAKSDWMKYI